MFVKELENSCHVRPLLLLTLPESNMLIQVVCMLGVKGDQKLICNLQRANSNCVTPPLPFSVCTNICRPVEQFTLTLT